MRSLMTKMMTCGLCGSGITADEKFKKQKNGNIIDMYIMDVLNLKRLIVNVAILKKKKY